MKWRPGSEIITELNEGLCRGFVAYLHEQGVSELDLSSKFGADFTSTEISLSDSGAILAARCIEKSQVSVVNFKGQRFSGEAWIPIVACLTSSNSEVISLNISQNRLRQHGPEVARLLAGPSSKVISLNMSGNLLKSHGPAVVQCLASPSSNVNTLDISNNRLEEQGPTVAEQLAHSFIFNLIGYNQSIEQSRQNYFRYLRKLGSTISRLLRDYTPYPQSLIEITSLYSTIKPLKFKVSQAEEIAELRAGQLQALEENQADGSRNQLLLFQYENSSSDKSHLAPAELDEQQKVKKEKAMP